MLKINASYGLKEGRPNFGSESALCSVEMEVSDSITEDELKRKIHSAFCIVREQCTAEISLAGEAHAPESASEDGNGQGLTEPPVYRRDPKAAKASNRQLKYITDMWTQGGGSISDLNARVRDEYGVQGLYELEKRQASDLVDRLKKETKKAA